MTLEERLRSTHRYATLNDFRLGLEYDEVQSMSGGRRHNFISRKVEQNNFSTQASEFVYLLNHNLAVVRVDDEPSADYEEAQRVLMQEGGLEKLLSTYPDKNKKSDVGNNDSPKKGRKAGK